MDTKFFAGNAVMSRQEMSLPTRESFLELRNDRTLRLKFIEAPLDKFWISTGEDYKQVSKAAIEILSNFAQFICANKAFHLCC